MSAIVALLPSMPPEAATVEIPDSMNAADRNKVLEGLGQISTAVTRIETRQEERQKADEQRFCSAEARIKKLEALFEAHDTQDVTKLRKALDEKTEQLSRVRWWGLSIVATLVTSAIVGLVVFFFSH